LERLLGSGPMLMVSPEKKERPMSLAESDPMTSKRLVLHPSVGLLADPERMTPSQKVAAVAKVRCLEHTLLEGDRVRRDLGRARAEELLETINDLRRALGWLEIDPAGQLRWPRSATPAASPAS
jgi:hypothetical protein